MPQKWVMFEKESLCPCFPTWSPKMKIKRSKSRSLRFVERKNRITLFLFENGLSPITWFDLIGAIGGEIKTVVEFWCFISDNSSQPLVNFLKFYTQTVLLSFYFRFIQVHFPQNNESQTLISTKIVDEKSQTNLWVSPPNPKPSCYLSSPLQNWLSFSKLDEDKQVFIKIDCCFWLFCWLLRCQSLVKPC